MSCVNALLVLAIVTLSAAMPTSAQRGFQRRAPALVISQTPYDGRFAFARLKFETGSGGYYYMGLPAWAHGYPRAEDNLARILNEVSEIRPHLAASNVMALDDPALGKFPVAYMAEPDYWTMNDKEAAALRAYILKGGFVIFDDFRDDNRNGYAGWNNFVAQMQRVIPNGRFLDLDPSFPIFHSFFEINTFDIIPQAYDRSRPVLRGLFVDNDPKKRMLAIVNFNTDVSDFWEFSGTGFRPIAEGNEAYKLGVNYIVYSLTH
jgi:hypothetical protein